jgi:hypothetical protein
MDERILRVDRENAALCSLDVEYAEVFELEHYGGNKGFGNLGSGYQG